MRCMVRKREQCMCKYSFIIPVYNCAEFLYDCVQSVLHQAESDFEILLINDGSTDSSGKLCDELAEKYSPIKVFHKKNGGAASARNVGIDNAKGRYIIFVDGDDTLDSSFLSKINQSINKDACDLVIFGMSFDYYNKDVIEKSDTLSCNYNGTFTYGDFIKDFKGFFYDNCVSSACNKVFLSDIIQKSDLHFNEKMNLYEDFEFVLRYMNDINQFVFLNKPFYHYRHNIDDNHLYSRVKDLNRLKLNLHILLNTMIDLKNSDKNIMDIAANLYMSLLMQHIMYHKASYKRLKKALPDYCSDNSFRNTLKNGGRLNQREQELLSLIDEERFFSIFIKFNIRKINSKLKRFVKNILVTLKVIK